MCSFYINLPIGGLAAAVIVFFFKSPPRKSEASVSWLERLNQLDPIGTSIFVPSIVCLLLALQWGGTTYNWGNARIIVLFIIFAILICIFIGVQIWKGEQATIPPRIFTQRSVAAACWFGLCLGGAFFTFVYYIPIWFQAIKGTSATESGIRNLPLLLSQVVGAMSAGALVTKLGYYTPFMIASSVIMSIGAGLITTWQVSTGHPMWIGYQVIFGLGTGLGFQQGIIASQTVLELKDVPTGTATVLFIQLLGGALFVSVSENIFTNRLRSNLMVDAPGVDPNIVLQVGATDLKTSSSVPAAEYPGVLVAYNHALTQTYYIAVALSALSIFGAAFMQWKSVKGKKIEAAAA